MSSGQMEWHTVEESYFKSNTNVYGSSSGYSGQYEYFRHTEVAPSPTGWLVRTTVAHGPAVFSVSLHEVSDPDANWDPAIMSWSHTIKEKKRLEKELERYRDRLALAEQELKSLTPTHQSVPKKGFLGRFSRKS